MTSPMEPTLRSDLLAGQVAIVTGGGQGIGAATARTLAANGAHVCVADVDEPRATDIVAGLAAPGIAVVGDLADPAVPEHIVERTVETFGRLDIVVNNAGYNWDAPVRSMSDEQFQAMLDIHVLAPFRLCRAAYPHFRAAAEAEGDDRRYRKVVMVSSLAATFGIVGAGNYASAKAGVVGLARTLANEWGSIRVCVNSVAFGAVSTRLGQPQSDSRVVRTGGREIQVGVQLKTLKRMGFSGEGATDDEEIYEPRPLRSAALGRLGTIQEAADAIFYLCSPLSNYVTGQVLPVSGGQRGGLA
jgi:3-oxoacyl-[acyl-carrier protein] reductase